ncbi:MAG: hypothetical protein ACHQUC_00445 [Chlamydiales bacterium]
MDDNGQSIFVHSNHAQRDRLYRMIHISIDAKIDMNNNDHAVTRERPMEIIRFLNSRRFYD